MKHTVILFFFLTSIVLATPLKTFAHILQTDRNIGAVLHIDPEDDPIAGAQSSFFFEFKDKEGKFKPVNCDCTFRILEAGKEIYSQPLFQNNTDPNLENASVFYTFKQKDVYTVKVTGKPNTNGDFQPFVLSYDIRVAREANTSNAPQTDDWIGTHVIHLVLGIGIFMFALFVIFKKRKTNERT